MKNKRGFSLVELIGVIALLAILLMIAVPQVITYIRKGKQNYYQKLENEVALAGANYVEEYRALLPRQIGHVRVVGIDELVNNKYIDEVIDEAGEKCTGKVIIEKTKKNSYEYNTCLICGEDGKYYKSKQEVCNKNEGMNIYTDSADFTIVVDSGPYKASLGEKYVAPMATVYHNGEPYKENGEVVRITGQPDVIPIYELKDYTVNYFYHGVTESIQVEVDDNTPPSTVATVLRYGDENGKIYKPGWSSVDLYVKYNAKDYTNKGVSGSGVYYYEVSSDGINYVRLDSDYEYLTTEGEHTRYVRAVDNEGNIGEVTSFVYKVDKTPPLCTWTGESTVWQPNLNLPEAERVYERNILLTCSDNVSDCMDIFKTKSWTENTTMKTKEYTYTVFDLAGNYTVCNKEANIYIDKTPPEITGANPLSLGTQDHNFAANISIVDQHSGVNESLTYCDPAESRKTGSYTVTCYAADNNGNQGQFSFTARHNIIVAGRTESNSMCGTESCNCHEDCTGGFNELQCSCADNEGDTAVCNEQIGGCWYICSHWDTSCDTCNKSCTIYTCPTGTRHSDGSIKSRTDSVCWY